MAALVRRNLTPGPAIVNPVVTGLSTAVSLEWANQALIGKQQAAVTNHTITISPSRRFRAAMIPAIIADALQIFAFPLFVEGPVSSADDILDCGIGAVLACVLGWH
jgi:hypothetical protein